MTREVYILRWEFYQIEKVEIKKALKYVVQVVKL